jgi:hypothetical protein
MPLTKGINLEDQVGPGATVERTTPTFESVGIACTATLVPSLLLVHGLAALLHTEHGISPAAVAVSFTVIAVGLVHALIQWRFSVVPVWCWIVTPVVAAVLLVVTKGSITGALSVGVCCSMQGLAQSRVALTLPATIGGQMKRRPWRAVAWSLIALLAVVQTARLATHEADPEVSWWVTTKNPAWAGHLCMSAYVFAADLHNQGETNIYGADYPPGDSSTGRHPMVENLKGHIECGFQYPPPFLLLPWAALQVTNDFYVIRPVWLAINGLGFLAAAVVLCLWVGGSRGRLALWLLPAMWVAVPTLQTFQFGQFHLMAFGLAVTGMVALETRRTGLGGALLGAAVVTKLYPAVLLLLLAVQRRWRALGMTVIWMVGFGALGLLLLGPAPYQAFLTHQLPGILDGSAFDFSEFEPAARDNMTAIIVSVSTLPGRLGLLGAPLLPEDLGPWLGRALAVVILALVWRAGRGSVSSRGYRVMLWLALLNLVVLQGPVAFVDYTTATSLWLLTFVSLDMVRNRTLAISGWICWLLVGTLLGTFPIPDDPTGVWPDVAISPVQISLSTLLITILLLLLNFWCAMRRDSEPRIE